VSFSHLIPEVTAGLYLFGAIVSLFLLFGSLTDRLKSRPFMEKFIYLLTANFLMLISQAGIWLMEEVPELISLLKVFHVASLSSGYLVITLFAYCIVGFINFRRKVSYVFPTIFTILSAIIIVLIALSPSYGLLFDFDSKGAIFYNTYFLYLTIGEYGMMVVEMGFLICFWKAMTIKEFFCLLTFGVLPLISIPLHVFWPEVPLYLTTTLSLIVMYMLFHNELTRQLMEKEHQLAESRIAIMLSQIQPHFLYNSLGAIRELCRQDPEAAREALGDFAFFLRSNMDSLTSTDLIPFSKELEHVQNYLSLEQLRFGEKLKVVFDTEEKDFLLPPLSIQPLVENAVNHGLFPSENGGTVTIKTRRTGNKIAVTITDDGVGFDPHAPSESDSKKHVGIQNVRSRVESMARGTLTIQSMVGEGTTATLLIPVK